jgi:hypothetical protein
MMSGVYKDEVKMTMICAYRTGFCRRRLRPTPFIAVPAGVLAALVRNSLPVSVCGATLLVLLICVAPALAEGPDKGGQAHALGRFINSVPAQPSRDVATHELASPARLPSVSSPPTAVAREIPSPSTQPVLELSHFIFTKIKPSEISSPQVFRPTTAIAEPAKQRNDEPARTLNWANFIKTMPFDTRESNSPAAQPNESSASSTTHDAAQALFAKGDESEQLASLDYRQQPEGNRGTNGHPHVLVRLVQPPENEVAPKTDEEIQQGTVVGQNSKEVNPNGLKPICAVSVNIRKSVGLLPPNYAAARFEQGAKDETACREHVDVVFSWEASALCHNPLYFEEANVERYGYRTPYLQPVVSAANFFARIPALPYLMGADRPRDCIYTLGYYRPGSYAPYRIQHVPLSVRGGIYEAGVLTGLFYLIP